MEVGDNYLERIGIQWWDCMLQVLTVQVIVWDWLVVFFGEA